jgi:LPS-assembly lipoprotein
MSSSRVSSRRRPGSHSAPAFAGVTASAVMTFALLLPGCGFQLRGEPSVGLKTLHVSAVGASNVATEVRRALATSPTQLMPTSTGAEAHLQILGEARDKTIFTITGTGRVYEFQLRLAVRYQLTVPGRDAPVIAPTEIDARRRITYSETAPVAKEQEEQLLYEDMQADLAGQILRRIAVARRDM